MTALENAISDRREFYNESVNVLNVRIEQVPDVIIARMTGFQAATLLEFPAEDLHNPDIKALFQN